MAYIYLLNLYEEIEERLQQIDSLSAGKFEKIRYQQGRRDVLRDFRLFLTENMNNKLPKRIRKLLSEQNS